MYNGIMDPELMRLAQEQMSRIPPEEIARIHQQMISNPELVRLASESMKNMRPEDLRRAAEQLKHTRAEDMVEISEKVAKVTPEEIAAMKAHADAQISYETSAAQMLKQQGNDLHSRGQYDAAANKYLLAKNKLKGIPSSKGGILQLQCSLNLMSCYLKTGQFEDCIKEGSEVLAYDSKNVKALYRRGQAYKELGNLEAAVSDLSKAHEISPEDETIAVVFRNANEKLMKGGDRNVSGCLVIEEIDEEETRPIPSESHKISSAEYSVSQPVEDGECSQNGGSYRRASTADVESLESLRDNPEAMRLFPNYVSKANPDTLATMGVGGMSPDLVKTATDMISKMKPEELQKMLPVASSLNGRGPSFPLTSNINGDGSRFGSQIPEMTPDMVKMASDRISKMSPEELQKMLEVASSVNVNDTPFPTVATDGSTQRSESGSQSSATAGMSPDMVKTATDMISKMKAEDLQKMLQVASSLNGRGPSFPLTSNINGDGSRFGSQIPEMTPDMVKMASDRISKMSPEELQKMLEVASSVNVNGTAFPTVATDGGTQRSESGSQSSATAGSPTMGHLDAGKSISGGLFSNSRIDQSSPSLPTSSTDLQGSLRNSMKDPAMQQMFTSMMKNLSPEMMANMSEQFGMKLSREDAAKAQQAMSSLSPEDLDKMMRWAERAQRGVETVRKTKNWLFGKPGLILAIFMLILASIFHQLGFIGR